MKKIIVLLILCLAFIGCKDKKYTEAELRVKVQKIIDAYEKDILPKQVQQAKDEGYHLGRNIGNWEDKIKLLEELEKQLPKEITEILNRYRNKK